MIKKEVISKYRLSFFFDYNCGGCLWCDNDTSREKLGIGCLDAELFDLDGKIIQDARIKLPDDLKQKVLYLDILYSKSINLDDPSGPSLWSKKQWDSFYKQTKELYQLLIAKLGDEYEIIYRQK
jgi:hypothetical protein